MYLLPTYPTSHHHPHPYSLTYSLTYLLTYLLTYSLTHSPPILVALYYTPIIHMYYKLSDPLLFSRGHTSFEGLQSDDDGGGM